MKRFITRSRIVKLRTAGGVSVTMFALLVGGMLIPISPASAEEVVATIKVASRVKFIAINPAGTFAYLTHGDVGGINRISKINLATNTVDSTFTVPTQVMDIAIDPTGRFAWVASWSDEGIMRIDLATNELGGVVFPYKRSVGMAIDPTGRFAYVTFDNFNRVIKVSLATGAIDASIKVGSEYKGGIDEAVNGGIAIDPTGKYAYVANILPGAIYKIDLATNTVVATIADDAIPMDIAIDPTGSFAYVSHFNSNFVSRINLATNKVDGSISIIAARAGGVAVDPTGRFAWVTNWDAGTVSKIKLANAIPLVTTAEPAVKSVSAKKLASVTAKLSVPKGATVTLRVAPASRKFCSVSTTKSGTFLNYLKDGLCKVTVTVNTKLNKSYDKTVTIAVRG